MTYRELKTVETDKAVMANIKKAVCVFYKINASKLFRNNRKRELVNARHVFHYLCHIKFGIPSGVVGNFSDRDHATVLHSSSKVRGWLEMDKEVQYEVSEIMKLYQDPTKWSMLKVTVKQFIHDIFKIIRLKA